MKPAKQFFTLAFIFVFAAAFATPVYAVRYDPNHIYYCIDSMRSEAGQGALVRNDGLDKIAEDYAKILFENAGFRKTTDFQTLPNGERVISLAKKNEITITGFNYSVFLGNTTERIEGTNEFQEKVGGDFNYVGIARIDGYDNNGVGAVVVVIVYAKTVY